MKKFIAYLLIVLSAALIYLGNQKGMTAPILTAVGFMSIAVIYLFDRKEP